jgi:hypothetical protein
MRRPGMSLPNVHGTGVSTGQPNRVDFNGAEHLDRLVPGRQLEIGDQGIDPSRQHTDVADELRRREALLAQQGALRDQRGGDWESFSGGRRGGGGAANNGTVRIDGPHTPEEAPPLTFTAQQLQQGAWAEVAASFEESQRPGTERRGEDGFGLPPITVDPTPTNPGGRPKNGRRAFRVG